MSKTSPKKANKANVGLDLPTVHLTDLSEASSINTSVVETSAANNKDERRVKLSRSTFLVALSASAAVLIALAFSLQKRDESHLFQQNFDSMAEECIKIIQNNGRAAILGVEAVSAIYTTEVGQTQSTLPFKTFHDFEPFAAKNRDLAKFRSISYVPALVGQESLEQWNAYSASSSFWVKEGLEFVQTNKRKLVSHSLRKNNHNHGNRFLQEVINNNWNYVDSSSDISAFVYWLDSSGKMVAEDGDGFFAPVWQTSPAPEDASYINFNLASDPWFEVPLSYVMNRAETILSTVVTSFNFFSVPGEKKESTPASFVFHPIIDFSAPKGTNDATGFVIAFLSWNDFFSDVLTEVEKSILVVLNGCDKQYSFTIKGSDVEYMGEGDLHDSKYSKMKKSAEITEFATFEQSGSNETCHYGISLYPTESFQACSISREAWQYATVVASAFIIVAVLFLLYDYFVSQRQLKTERRAEVSSAIVEELFPGTIASRLYTTDGGPATAQTIAKQAGKAKSLQNMTPSSSSGEFHDGNTGKIAEMYPAATILFADIAGFTAWSSIREAHQVFTLLENIFQGFDALAELHGVFKVETIGDCYVAVCGVPKPKKDHAVCMVSFARDAMDDFVRVVRSLELKLGPDTAELALRVGIHSGPVTAGVLKCQKARFQLFGDSINTASRIESLGLPSRIHLSEQTAAELVNHGKESWIVKRDEQVEAKGKGLLTTFWLKLNCGSIDICSDEESTQSEMDNKTADESISFVEPETAMNASKSFANPVENATSRLSVRAQIEKLSQREQRLADWNSEILLGHLKNIQARRNAMKTRCTPMEVLTKVAEKMGQESLVVDEVMEIIEMPEYVEVDATAEVTLDDDVIKQVHDYVSLIASLYNDNPFHNFEHASHVTMSVSKLLSRIVRPQRLDDDDDNNSKTKQTQTNQNKLLHDHTFGINSDPLTQFACIFSALVHDVGHAGIPNFLLIQEDVKLATLYHNKSVAEQNSVDVAWKALLLPEFTKFRTCIFGTLTELRRFRSLIVNAVIATDIFDREQNCLRKKRWNKAFNNDDDDDIEIEPGQQQSTVRDISNRKATIVIEHAIQASDVAHTMQHWHVYRKWNERLFHEMLLAYKQGRSDKNPVENWYNGEISFFDNYVIPLAKKLGNCGVFGVSCDEHLNYATNNRNEWVTKGNDMVQTFVNAFNDKYPQYNNNVIDNETLIDI